jgi:hypothetical protein
VPSNFHAASKKGLSLRASFCGDRRPPLRLR